MFSLAKLCATHCHPMECLGEFFWCLLFSIFHAFLGVLEARRSRLPFPPLVAHVLSEVSTLTHQSWVALHVMAHSFIELHKPLHQTPPWRGFMQSFMCKLCTCMCCWAVANAYSPVFSTTMKKQNLPVIAESPVCHSFTSQTWPQTQATADMFLR